MKEKINFKIDTFDLHLKEVTYEKYSRKIN